MRIEHRTIQRKLVQQLYDSNEVSARCDQRTGEQISCGVVQSLADAGRNLVLCGTQVQKYRPSGNRGLADDARVVNFEFQASQVFRYMVNIDAAGDHRLE